MNRCIGLIGGITTHLQIVITSKKHINGLQIIHCNRVIMRITISRNHSLNYVIIGILSVKRSVTECQNVNPN